ncbi:hypothetical protein KEM48_000088 [Puccinia striiformis f. sp. tritici PST-130]|nr:hypothetical protein KEM48_000088 [Puccinia striiformis f. sp. tritici PST-130]
MLAQTTNSGFNNNTMASTMYELLFNDTEITSENTDPAPTWDPKTMHIQCFCHKLALTVNAGLAALFLITLPPAKIKASVLGFFSVLGRLVEEEEPEPSGAQSQPNSSQAPNVEVIEDPDMDNEGSESDYGNANNEGSDEDSNVVREDSGGEGDNAVKSRHRKTSRLLILTQKLDIVIKQITRSAAPRANFTQISQQLNLKVAPLIAGYAIRWNIKYQSHKKAIDAQEVIDQVLKEDQETNGAGDFNNVLFSPRNWKEIDNLNREMEVFVKLTSEMEGNSATGTHIIPKYLELKEALKRKLADSTATDLLYPMFHAMLKRVQKYLDEACDAAHLFLQR